MRGDSVDARSAATRGRCVGVKSIHGLSRDWWVSEWSAGSNGEKRSLRSLQFTTG